ncbi:hypothetical protein GCM10023201_57310 [Actinomycetospora corticicola]|uniref:Uncharacterized protein n=1 Tax=Actinomycetospora corticicola TaxID=663602 RepID=A0A7Y9DRZ0_9PSEU|nr:hypothetical protein [Actinomycetospora corticicola]NYD34354.1 hypothetical protein [Actinomycetospora corticicola]
MTNLAALLDTWQQWNAHHVMAHVPAHEAGEPAVSALEALRDSRELVELLSGWQWQAVHAARRDGTSWEQIAATSGTTDEQARAEYVAVLDRQEAVLGRDVRAYREVL